MACKTCGAKSKRFSRDIAILNADNKVIAKNYERLKHLPTNKEDARIRRQATYKSPAKPNIKKNHYQQLTEIHFAGKRINILTYDPNNKCIFIVGYMEGCGSCNYMKRLINKILINHLPVNVQVYTSDKSITDPKGFSFSGNPTILFVDKGKVMFQVGGIFNNIEQHILDYISK